MSKLESGGHTDAAAELRNGFACLTGLTDGWAHFLESIDKVEKFHATRFAQADRDALAAIRGVAHEAVYRR